jgi:hypothetical protein
MVKRGEEFLEQVRNVENVTGGILRHETLLERANVICRFWAFGTVVFGIGSDVIGRCATTETLVQ